MITITKDHLKKGHRVRPGKVLNAQYITIHSTGNANSTAKNERAWLDNPSNTRDASWHLVIDETTCIEAIPLNEVAWHAGSGNTKSFGIEICESGNRQKTLDRAAELTAQLLKERNWGIDRLKRHYDWTQKSCPWILMANNWAGWEAFKKQVEGYLNKSEGPTVKAITILLNGKETKVSGYVENGTTYLQARELCNLIGATLSYDAQTKKVTSTLNGKKSILTGTTIEGRTYVQMRILCEALGLKVGYNGKEPTITL